MGNYETGKQEILQQCSENSRSQIVFRTDIFRKLTLGAPKKMEVTKKYVINKTFEWEKSELICETKICLLLGGWGRLVTQ